MRKVFLVVGMLYLAGCTTTTHTIQAMATHKDRLVFTTIELTDSLFGESLRQTVQSCEMPDATTISCKEANVQYTTPQH